MPTPLVSILMPVKNAARWLDECLYSIRQQSLREWELVVVDDHSSDHSREVVLRHAASDPRILLFRQTGEGISPALQLALEQSRGSHITRMDADDRMPPHKLLHFLEAAKKHPGTVVTGKVRYFSEEGTVSPGYRHYEHWLNGRVDRADHRVWMYRECVVAGANWLTHRDLLPERLDGLAYPEDYDLVFHWYRQDTPVLGLNEVSHHWREHRWRTSRNHSHYSQESFFKLKLGRFLEIDRMRERPLIILGRNSKARLAQRILQKTGTPATVLDKPNLDTLKSIDAPQLLVAVYPSSSERKVIAQFLDNLALKMGRDWWWL